MSYELYEADTRKHQQEVAKAMINVVKILLDRAMVHDASKFDPVEIESYIGPVCELNTTDVQYGSDRYKELTALMGKGWDHHKKNNDHHIEYHVAQVLDDPIRRMDLFCLLEMLCDWIGASKRKNNDPGLPLKHIAEKYKMDGQLQQLIRNTLRVIHKKET